MTEPREGATGGSEKSIEEILRRKEELNQLLQDQFQREVTILFTDICGYTKYMETMGDIKGRAMLQKHNDIVFGIIERCGGRVIKTIGDAVMATFEAPADGVRAAINIQTALAEHNARVQPADQIRVKIGINHGTALIDDKDLFGDAVNVAARVQAKAGADEILVSGDLFQTVCGSDDILCRFHGDARLKGKSEAMPLYRVVWQDEDQQLKEHQTRAQAADPSLRPHADLPVFHLEVTREDQRLKLSAYEQRRGESSTVRHYEETTLSIDGINQRCQEIVEILNKANRSGRISRETLTKLRAIGQVFSDELFTPEVKQKLDQTSADHLVIAMDDQLVQIPWELLHDGQQFLCQRFAMGRLVKTRQSLPASAKPRHLARPLKMLVLADPKKDLKGAYVEGQRVVARMDQDSAVINASLRSDGITPGYIKEKIRNFDIIHFAGHSDYDAENPAESGWRLSEGRFRAADIHKMAGTAAMPALIFANACQSARTEEWGIVDTIQDDIFGLANAFVLAGVKHYIGTFWEILDEPSSRFAEEFYHQVLSGQSVGEALRKARQALILKYGEETIVWGSYLLYGDPTYNYLDQVGDTPAVDTGSGEFTVDATGGVRTDAETISFGKPETPTPPSRKVKPWAAIAAVLLLVAGGAAFFLFGAKPDTAREQAAMETLYAGGRYDEALQAARAVIDKDPSVRKAYLAMGNVNLKKGNMNAAKTAFEKAAAAATGTEGEKAQALLGLGRLASINKDSSDAVEFYRAATATDPGFSGGYLAQAMMAEKNGDTTGALSLLERAASISPKDPVLQAMMADLRKKAAYANDKARQERIDQLVTELLGQMDASEAAPADADTWTSNPLTIWIMDFECSGYTLQEGMPRLLTTGLTEALLADGRFQVVERALLDKLMAELKLGSSTLADRRTALALGRIAAARLVLVPKATFGAEDTNVSLRIFETETSRVTAAVSEAFGSDKGAADISEALASVIDHRLDKKYPVRGRVTQVGTDGISLNIGDSVGVREGQRFKVIGVEAVLEVVAVASGSCQVKQVEGEGNLSAGARVQRM